MCSALSKSITKGKISHHKFQFLDFPDKLCKAEMLLQPGENR